MALSGSCRHFPRRVFPHPGCFSSHSCLRAVSRRKKGKEKMDHSLSLSFWVCGVLLVFHLGGLPWKFKKKKCTDSKRDFLTPQMQAWRVPSATVQTGGKAPSREIVVATSQKKRRVAKMNPGLGHRPDEESLQHLGLRKGT